MQEDVVHYFQLINKLDVKKHKRIIKALYARFI